MYRDASLVKQRHTCIHACMHACILLQGRNLRDIGFLDLRGVESIDWTSERYRCTMISQGPWFGLGTTVLILGTHPSKG